MWLLPALSFVSRLAARTFYRLDRAGGKCPAEGPVLLVANHPNSLLDPALVAAAADRPVRFLAKAPLFSDWKIGWLVRGAGAIPIYRAVDDPAVMGRNDEMFRAVHAALAAGSAVGIFPEGLSHSEPSLAPLKTGAARIALGAAAGRGAGFPIVPVGLCYRAKERFRSEALINMGDPVAWEDLALRGGDDPDAVRALTARIDASLREVTVNLARWEDAPLVEWAEAIHGAELGASGDPALRVARLREAARTLARLRREGDERWAMLAREVLRHGRLLEMLRLRPGDLHREPRMAAAAAWMLRQLCFFLVGAPLGAAGAIVFYPPYRLTGIAEARARLLHDVRSTYKVLAGAFVFVLWIVLLAGAAGALGGPAAGLSALVGLPALALLTLAVHERLADARADARRFLLLPGRRGLHQRLRERQREIAAALGELHGTLTAAGGSGLR